MQKLIETLQQMGIEIPADKQAEVKKALSEHYKNVAEYNKAIAKLETDRDNWKSKAEAAEETLNGLGNLDDLKNVQTELAEWKKKAEDAEKNAQAQIYERDFNDALKTELESVKFSSDAAKRAIMAEIKDAGLKLKDGKILGLSDLITQMREKDASAFIDEKQAEAQRNAARFTAPAGRQATPSGVTRKDIESMTDKADRQRAIAENLSLFKQ